MSRDGEDDQDDHHYHPFDPGMMVVATFWRQDQISELGFVISRNESGNYYPKWSYVVLWEFRGLIDHAAQTRDFLTVLGGHVRRVSI